MTEIATPVEQPTADTPSVKQIAQHYSAAMDSVNLINAGQPEGMMEADWLDTVARNKAHLEIMLAKTYWTTEDLTPLQQAAA